uniref:hypothetical protein n=1 Tax=Actinokineospora sp. CA-119265 TaxID=3239890 RepID=UPI003F499A78
MSRERYELVFHRAGKEVDRVHTDLDVDDEDELRAHLIGAALRAEADPQEHLAEFSLAVHRPNRTNPDLVYVTVYRD